MIIIADADMVDVVGHGAANALVWGACAKIYRRF
jgi:hypothetical protein